MIALLKEQALVWLAYLIVPLLAVAIVLVFVAYLTRPRRRGPRGTMCDPELVDGQHTIRSLRKRGGA